MNIKYDDKGLVPAVVQDASSGDVLMVAYMNSEAVAKTLETGKATFWSRSRNELWVKGMTSGNVMEVKEVLVDCDEDCLLVRVNPTGPACHTGKNTCFYRKVDGDVLAEIDDTSRINILSELTVVTKDRKENPQSGSYTNYLFEKGEDKILKKVGEEAAEVVIAGKNHSKEEITYEVADLMYHLTVMLVDQDLTWEDIYKELEKRR